MSRIARIAPRPHSQTFLVCLASAGLVLAIGVGFVLPAALAFARV